MYDLYGITINYFYEKVFWHNARKNNYIRISSLEDFLFSCYLIHECWSYTKLNKFARIIKRYLEV